MNLNKDEIGLLIKAVDARSLNTCGLERIDALTLLDRLKGIWEMDFMPLPEEVAGDLLIALLSAGTDEEGIYCISARDAGLEGITYNKIRDISRLLGLSPTFTDGINSIIFSGIGNDVPYTWVFEELYERMERDGVIDDSDDSYKERYLYELACRIFSDLPEGVQNGFEGAGDIEGALEAWLRRHYGNLSADSDELRCYYLTAQDGMRWMEEKGLIKATPSDIELANRRDGDK